MYPHPTTGYLDNICYRELISYLRHTEWQVGISLTFFFHFIYFSKESTSFYHIHEKYSVSPTFRYNGNSKCYVVRILYAISFQWSTCFGYRGLKSWPEVSRMRMGNGQNFDFWSQMYPNSKTPVKNRLNILKDNCILYQMI